MRPEHKVLLALAAALTSWNPATVAIPEHAEQSTANRHQNLVWLYSHRNPAVELSEKWWPFARRWNSQSFPNPMFFKSNADFSELNKCSHYDRLAYCSCWDCCWNDTCQHPGTSPKPWLEFESTFKRNMTEIWYQREWRLLAYFWPH